MKEIQARLLEISKAIEQLQTTTIAYKIIGSVMIQKNRDELIKELLAEKVDLEKQLGEPDGQR